MRLLDPSSPWRHSASIPNYGGGRADQGCGDVISRGTAIIRGVLDPIPPRRRQRVPIEGRRRCTVIINEPHVGLGPAGALSFVPRAVWFGSLSQSFGSLADAWACPTALGAAVEHVS